MKVIISDGTEININGRDKNGIINTDVAGKIDYNYLFENYINGVGVNSFEITEGEFRRVEPIIDVLNKISQSVLSKATYLDYYDGIYIICYKPFSNGGSNILYYFEDNNTFMFFNENGPNIKTETSTSTFLDIVG